MKFSISLLVVFSATITNTLAAGTCVTTSGVKCLDKSAVASFSGYFKGAVGPCADIWSDGTPYCFTDASTGMSGSCDCTKCSCDVSDAGVTAGVVYTGYGASSASPTPSATCALANAAPSCTADKTTYCALSQQSSVCKYCGTAAACTSICTKGLSLAAKTEIVTAHNNLRRLVAKGGETRGAPGPQNPASNMIELVWDTELEKVAQLWTEQCIDGHDVDRMTPNNLGWVGQNWAMVGGGAVNYTSFVQMWYDEVKYFPKGNNVPWSTTGATGTTGHYTAVAWAKTQKVGCGYIQRKAGMYLICNYWPGGNMGGDTMYLTGTAASACPKGTTASNGLCKQQ